jgi:RNA polymerase sigma-70 factor (ECF subfamily)
LVFKESVQKFRFALSEQIRPQVFNIFVEKVETNIKCHNKCLETASDMLYKICIVMLCNEQDAQDVIQETFFRYLEKAPVFTDTEHEKAWLIRVAANHCKDVLRFRFRHPQVPIDLLAESLVMEQEQQETLTKLFELPVKQRTVIYLYYVEGYQMKEIADILGISVQADKKRMQRGREQLRVVWKEECCR